MPSAVGAIIRGASAGLEDIEERETAKEEKEYKLKRRGREEEEYQYKKGRRGVTDIREDVEYEQGQEEREYAIGRRGITDVREDKTYQQQQDEYQIKTDAAQFQREISDAKRQFIMSEGADYQKIMDVYNHEFPDGRQIQMSRNPDGTYNLSLEDTDGTVRPVKNLSMDDIGMRLEALSDPNAYYKATRERRAKESERKFEREKIRLTGDEKVRQELAKQGINVGGAGGVSLKVAQQIYKQTKDYYGKGFEGMWSFEEGKAAQSSAHNLIATSFIQADPGGGLAGAHENAARYITDISKQAEETAAAEVEAGTIEQETKEQRQTQIFRALTDGLAGKLKERRPKPALSRTDTKKPGKKKAPATADEYYKALKDHPKNKDVSDNDIRAAVKKKFKDWGASKKTVVDKGKNKPAITRKEEKSSGNNGVIDAVGRLVKDYGKNNKKMSRSMARSQLKRLEKTGAPNEGEMLRLRNILKRIIEKKGK